MKDKQNLKSFTNTYFLILRLMESKSGCLIIVHQIERCASAKLWSSPRLLVVWHQRKRRQEKGNTRNSRTSTRQDCEKRPISALMQGSSTDSRLLPKNPPSCSAQRRRIHRSEETWLKFMLLSNKSASYSIQRTPLKPCWKCH